MSATKDPKAKKSKKSLIERHTDANREAAHIILQNPLRYGGGDSLMVRWANMVIHGYQPTEKNWGLVA